MQTNQLKRVHPNKKSRQVGRGGTRGKTSGRGTKGQKARAGHKLRPEFRDTLKKLPKLRGRGKNSLKTIQEKNVVLSIAKIEKTFASGDIVSLKTLSEKKLIQRSSGRLPEVKLLGGGVLTKKIAVHGMAVSESAQKAILAAGGTVAGIK